MLGVQISNLSHEFDGRRVFGPIDFAYSGSCLAITGPNGSGKSTLLRMLAGLLTPMDGIAGITRDGEPVDRQSMRDLIGMAAPDLRLYAELSARENLQFLLRARGIRECDAMAEAALGRVGLLERADDPVGELSSGMRQRAALAAAIAHGPAVLLLDEPSSNLDEPGIRMVRELIDWQSAKGMVIIATNDPLEAEIASERLCLGNAG